METVLCIMLGVGLASACGFRVFIPPLVMSVAAMAGHLSLAPDFRWIGTWPALLAFATATALEIGAYYVPWLDNLLDAVATPAAVVAGIVVSASVMTDVSPLMKWTLAVVAGGGAAGMVQAVTVKARALSSLFTLGTGNHVVSTAESAGAVAASGISILIPVFAVVVLAGVALLGVLLFFRRSRARAPGAGRDAAP